MIFSTLEIKGDSPIYEQIEKHIEKAIQTGALIKDSKLPSTRETSSVLKVSRNTVMTAYENLESRGIIYSVKGKGSFVKIANQSSDQGIQIDWSKKLSHYGTTCENMDIIKTEYRYEKGMISFKSIAPEGNLFDTEEFKRAFLDVISMEGEKLLNYGYAQGYRRLIDYLMEYMQGKGVELKDKDILVTNGFTEGLDILLSAYTVPGDKVICEMPTHHTTIKMMKAYGLEIIGVSMDEQGVRVDELAEKIIEHQPKWIYLTPSYQNPTGIVMSPERRREVYKVLIQYKMTCIEDGFNEELLYSGSHVMPLIALSGSSNNIIYLGSLSKILFPGLRLGWIMADKNCISILESVKRAKNIHTSFLDQAIFVQYMSSGAFERYVKKVRKYYRDRYLFMIEEIKKYIPYKKIYGEGGLHVYITLNDNIDTRELLEQCYARGVLFMPGDIFMANQSRTSSLRLGFGKLEHHEIVSGLKIISEEIQRFTNDK
ncbi:MAG: PLP-dependent aminotransferase family protein [Cellulosilyticum sp.]|nr:PLP-dependent aminotransferase family protein [Cellulosilyticum sp.]